MEETPDSRSVMGEEEKTVSFWSRMGNIFVSPTKTFEAIDKKPTWFWPFIIMILVSLIASYLIMPQQMKIAIDSMSKQENVTQEQMQVAMKFIPISIMATSVVMVAVWYFLYSLLYYLAGSVLLGGNSTYKKVLSLQAWTSFIVVVSSIVRIPLVRAKDSVMVSLSPAMLLPSDYLGTKLYTFLMQLDFFSIWYLIVMGLGFSYIYRFSKGKAYAAVIICWLMWVGLTVLLTPSTA